MKKGFVSVLIAILASAFAIGAMMYAEQANRAAQLSQQNMAMMASDNAKFGSVAQTQLSDTIGTFRTNVNTDLFNLDANLAAATATLGTRGTLFTINSPLPVANGGTALTTQPVDLQVPTAVSGVLGYKALTASSGVTITTTTTNIYFSTPGFDNTANISFTGNNTFAGSSTFNGRTNHNATATFSSSTVFTGSVSFGSSTIPRLAAASNIVSTVFTTQSTAFTNTNASATVTTGGTSRLFVTFSGTLQLNSTTGTILLDVAVDGTRAGNGNSNGIEAWDVVNSGKSFGFSISYLTGQLSSGSHTANLQVRTANGAHTVTLGVGGDPATLTTVQEIYN